MYPNFDEEKILQKKGFKCVAGLDEAGRGPLAGPVVAAAVIIINPKSEYRSSKQIQITKIQNQKRVSDFVFRISDLNVMDSKQLSQKQREYLYKVLTRHPDVEWGIGIVSEKIIDRINILEATKLAMQKALRQLQSKLKTKADFLLIDGNFSIDPRTGPWVLQKAIVKGDQKVFSISAASIIAKVTRDKIMDRLHKKYPQYGFCKHKGYGTKLHMEMIKKHGACPAHRKSFYPVKVIHS